MFSAHPRRSIGSMREKTIAAVIGLLLIVGLTEGAAMAAVNRQDSSPLIVFVRPVCPYCERAKQFLSELQARRPTLQVQMRDIAQDPLALQELNDLAHRFGIRPVGVPAFYLDGQLLVGFESAATTGKEIESRLDRSTALVESTIVDVPFFGPVNYRALGLPLFTIVLGLIDGFNPCAMWVLLFLLSMLLNLRDRKKMFLIGGVFVLVSGLVYFAFMAAWLNLFLWIGLSPITFLVLGAIAATLGLVNVKDFFAFGQGPSVGIPVAAKPHIYRRVREILYAENVFGALTAVVLLAFLVNTVELVCTAGIPALFTRVLTLSALPTWAYYGYLVLYNVAYMADDSLMLAVAVVTLSREKLQEKGARWLKLVSGLVMLVLGLILMLMPQWLTR